MRSTEPRWEAGAAGVRRTPPGGCGAFRVILDHFLLALCRAGPTFFMLGFPPASGSYGEQFFAPVLDLLPGARHTRDCPAVSDRQWLLCGISRTIEDQKSGRAFLQKFAVQAGFCPERGNFFEMLKSKRRLDLCRELNSTLCRTLSRTLPDPFADFTKLRDFDIHAADGHFHAAACHDPRDKKGTKWATGHVYMLDLRSRAMRHLDTGDIMRRKEHEIRLLKRTPFETLRAGAPAGRRVLLVYDRACIDFAFWHKAKMEHGLYFISRPKENLNLQKGGYAPVNAADPVNAGVISDEQVAPATHMRHIRRITWENPESGGHWEFLTNELTLEPGLIVYLYLRRWDIEKTFDEFKNKLEERKSWATRHTAKCMQAQFLCLAHNLMVLEEERLRKDHAITNVAEDRRREKRLKAAEALSAKAGRKLSALQKTHQRATQCSVKFVRWLRAFLFHDAPRHHMLDVLKRLYATP